MPFATATSCLLASFLQKKKRKKKKKSKQNRRKLGEKRARTDELVEGKHYGSRGIRGRIGTLREQHSNRHSKKQPKIVRTRPEATLCCQTKQTSAKEPNKETKQNTRKKKKKKKKLVLSKKTRNHSRFATVWKETKVEAKRK
jgi:hypothetical protein